jgi:HlyD family type I secretion membrane fusion protein
MTDTKNKGRGPGQTRWTCGMPVGLGLLGVAVLISLLGVWGTLARIDGAVIAAGQVQVQSNRQVIQHQDGGVVSDILVKDGDVVTAGQVLLRLDGTFISSELAIIKSQLYEAMARRIRLTAERDSSTRLTVPAELEKAAAINPRLGNILDGQKRLFDARNNTMASYLEQLSEQERQLNKQILGIDIEKKSLSAQIELIADERASMEDLWAKGLTPKARMNALKREEIALHGRIGQLDARAAVIKGQAAELKIQKLQRKVFRREDAITQLRDIQSRENGLREKRLALEERMERLDIRSPAAGMIFDSQVFALQAVVRPADPIMYIVPQSEPVIVSARASPVDIDKIYLGQETVLRFTALDLKHAPDVYGSVIRFSADAHIDEQSGLAYYEVDILPDQASLTALEGQPIVPGMPVEAYVNTGERSPLSYLVKPLADYFNRAFRES